jgi:ABC-type dipeptide/oligopeptide/nickel transport system permease component
LRRIREIANMWIPLAADLLTAVLDPRVREKL